MRKGSGNGGKKSHEREGREGLKKAVVVERVEGDGKRWCRAVFVWERAETEGDEGGGGRGTGSIRGIVRKAED